MCHQPTGEPPPLRPFLQSLTTTLFSKIMVHNLEPYPPSNPNDNAGWAVALACYQPFNSSVVDAYFAFGGPGNNWQDYLRMQGAPPWCAGLWGGCVLVLIGIYSWSTVVFGLRFSNLTNRVRHLHAACFLGRADAAKLDGLQVGLRVTNNCELHGQCSPLNPFPATEEEHLHGRDPQLTDRQLNSKLLALFMNQGKCS